MTNATIHAACIANIPALTELFARRLVRTFEYQAEQHSGTVPAHPSAYDRAYLTIRETIAPVCDAVPAADGKMRNATLQLNHAKVAKVAAEMAEAAAVAWEHKINEKLGATEVEFVSAETCRFTVRGSFAGRKVRLHQEMIVNVSTKGRLFNQFPSRIYVDGKFTPAAKFVA